MNTTKKLLSLALALALGISLLAGCSKGDSSSADASSSSSASSAEATEPMDLTGVTDPYLATAGIAGDTVVATVGEYDVLADDVLFWLYYGIELFASENSSTDIPWDTELGGQTLEEYLLASALETAAFYRLIPEMAAKEGLELSQAELEYAEQELLANEAELGSAELVDHVMWFQMRSRDQYLRSYKAGSLYAMLQELYYGADSGSYPTDAEALAYAQDDLGYYRVKHILISTQNEAGEALDETAKAEKLALAEDLLAQLQAAEDKVVLFDELMNEYSEDPGLAYYPDGYEATPGEMVEEFETASLALKDGEISGIVESEFGYHIILRLPLSDLEQFRSALVSNLMQAKVNQWMIDNPTQTTDAWEQIDPPSYLDNVVALQEAVRLEVQAHSEAQSAASGSASSAG